MRSFLVSVWIAFVLVQISSGVVWGSFQGGFRWVPEGCKGFRAGDITVYPLAGCDPKLPRLGPFGRFWPSPTAYWCGWGWSGLQAMNNPVNATCFLCWMGFRMSDCGHEECGAFSTDWKNKRRALPFWGSISLSDNPNVQCPPKRATGRIMTYSFLPGINHI